MKYKIAIICLALLPFSCSKNEIFCEVKTVTPKYWYINKKEGAKLFNSIPIDACDRNISKNIKAAQTIPFPEKVEVLSIDICSVIQSANETYRFWRVKHKDAFGYVYGGNLSNSYPTSNTTKKDNKSLKHKIYGNITGVLGLNKNITAPRGPEKLKQLYPKIALKYGMSAKVISSFTILKNGRITDKSYSESANKKSAVYFEIDELGYSISLKMDKIIANEFIKAAKIILFNETFKPGLKNGKATSMDVQYILHFTVQ